MQLLMRFRAIQSLGDIRCHWLLRHRTPHKARSMLAREMTQLAQPVRYITIPHTAGYHNSAMPVKVIFEEYGPPSVLKVVPDSPGVPKAGEVKIKNKAIGLNLIETYFRRGIYKSTLPSTLGQEAAGIVESVGSGVNEFQPGDRVAYLYAGSYRDVHLVPKDKVVAIPDHVSFEQAAAILLKGLTAHYLLRQLAFVPQEGETVLFHAAAGGVGLIFLQWAHHLGIKTIATAGTDEKLALAKKHGAWATINYRTEDWVKRVEELTEGRKVRIVYDSVGKDTWEGSLDSLQKRGLLVSYGNASGLVPPTDINILNSKGALYVTRPSLFGYLDTAEDLRNAADTLFALVGEVINVQINHRFPLSQIAEAHAAIEGRKTTGSTVILPDSA